MKTQPQTKSNRNKSQKPLSQSDIANEKKQQRNPELEPQWFTPGCAEGDLKTIEEDIKDKEKKGLI